MTPKQNFLVEGIVNDMALWLMQDHGLSLKESLGCIYNSQTFEKLQKSETGLYAESPAYNYEILTSEIKNGVLIQEDF